MYTTLYIVLAFLLTACSNNEKSSSSYGEDFSSLPHFPLKVSNRIDLEEFDILKPQFVVRKDSLYLVGNNANNNIFNLIDPVKGTTLRGINRGGGPDEVMYISGIENDNGSIVAYDAIKQMLYTVSRSGDFIFINNKVSMSKERERVIFASFQNNAFAVSGYLSDCWARYTSSDGHKFNIPYPEIESIIELTDHEKSALLMNTNVAMSPDAKHMALSTTNGCVLAIYDCSPNGVKKVSFKVYDEPLFVVSQQSVAATTDSPVGFGDIFAGDKNLYCLYEKGTMGDLLKGHQSNTCLLVFNWKGELLKNYYLEKPLNTFGVDEERGILYGIGNDPEGCIFEYKL